MIAVRSAALATALAGAGCVSLDSPPRCWPVVVRDGASRPLADGDPLVLEAGPLRQYMAVVGIAAERIAGGSAGDVTDPTNPDYSVRLTQDSWGELARREGKLGFSARPDGTSELDGLRLVLWTDPAALLGLTCRLAVTVVDDGGNYCASDVAVVLTGPSP